jgi:hypothetical protein
MRGTIDGRKAESIPPPAGEKRRGNSAFFRPAFSRETLQVPDLSKEILLRDSLARLDGRAAPQPLQRLATKAPPNRKANAAP